MKQIAVAVVPADTTADAAALIECTACGPVAVDSTDATHEALGRAHLFAVHNLGGVLA